MTELRCRQTETVDGDKDEDDQQTTRKLASQLVR